MFKAIASITLRRAILLKTSSNSSRMASTYLIDDPKYSFLKDLGLERTNYGVYDGEWKGSGPALKSIDPATGKVIA